MPIFRAAVRRALPRVVLGCAVAGCAAPHGEASRPVDGTGRVARVLLATPGFDWRTSASPHFRVHVPAGSQVEARATSLADSAEAARVVALRLLGEPLELAGEPKAELFFLDTRDAMRRFMGRPIAGFAQPGELTAAFVAGDGYKPFLRHELTHAYASARWGELRGGEWITEGLAAIAQGDCQGHTVDQLAAGYVRGGAVPPLRTLAAEFRSVPELPGYLAAASVLDFLRRRGGIAAVRALWQNPRGDGHPLGPRGDDLEAEWRRYLSGLATAQFDSTRLIREGC